MPIDIGGALGGIGSFLGNQVSSAINSRRAWKYAKKSMALQDKYNRNMIRDYYGLNRESLTNADYNPLLALPNSAQGASYSPSMINSDSDAGDQAINSAIAMRSAKANIESAKSQTKLNESNSALAIQQAETEKSKRTQMEFQNAMLDVQKHLAQKDLDWYERKSYLQLYNLFQQAENYKASSAIGAMNAETNRQRMLNDYSLGKESNRISKKRAGFQNYKDYFDSKYGNPLKTAGFSWDKNTYSRQGGYPDFL